MANGMTRGLLGLGGAIALAMGAATTAQQAPTEVVIVGTVHAATPKYSVSDLVEILRRVKPAVILFEYPPELMTTAFSFRTLDPGSLEQAAVVQYAAQSGARIRPYDIEGRNAFFERTKYFARSAACNSELGAAIGKGLTPDAQRIAADLREANLKRDVVGASDPRTINSFDSDTALSRKQWLMNEGIPEIVRQTPPLTACAEFWDLSRAFWTRRNNEMLRNIRRFTRDLPGERVVVLAGFEHRYYLRSHFYDWDEAPAFILREYWQY
jgi:hypothetical protein